jgi:hypothetical protein
MIGPTGEIKLNSDQLGPHVVLMAKSCHPLVGNLESEQTLIAKLSKNTVMRKHGLG